MKQKSERLLKQRSDENSFWPTFTDLITTILLLVLLLLVTMVVFEQEKLAEQQQQIKDQQEQIEYLTGIRKDIIQDLDQEFKKRNLDVKVDPQTGTIKFSNDLLFATNKAEIRPKFKEYLKEFIPVYFSILYGKYQDHISEVVVEGHTDDVGTFMYNLELSQRRAFSVVKYILSEEIGNFRHKSQVKKQLTANGRSFSEVKRTNNGTIDRKNSRRVELKFRLE